MAEPDPDSRIIDLARLNNNTLTAIRDNKSVFNEFSRLDKIYIMFRADPSRFKDDCPYRPAPFDAWTELLDVIKNATEVQDLTTNASHNALLDLTTLQPQQLEAIANDVDAFAYLNFQEQVWLYNKLHYSIDSIEPMPFFPSKYLTTVITKAHGKGGKRKKSRKPSSHYKPTKSRKTRRRK